MCLRSTSNGPESFKTYGFSDTHISALNVLFDGHWVAIVEVLKHTHVGFRAAAINVVTVPPSHGRYSVAKIVGRLLKESYFIKRYGITLY